MNKTELVAAIAERTACNKTNSRKRGGGDRRTGVQHGLFG